MNKHIVKHKYRYHRFTDYFEDVVWTSELDCRLYFTTHSTEIYQQAKVPVEHQESLAKTTCSQTRKRAQGGGGDSAAKP